MAHKTVIRSFWVGVLFITGLAFVGYEQYQASLASAKEAARRAELFRTRDAADARQADSAKGRPRAVPPGKGPGR